ncbi:hypothetical protein C8R46DRAFT_1207123 [Mycena filopes]|nr:hypothetical protein C8R46DRAFT_1207123 [Mycena filopes]
MSSLLKKAKSFLRLDGSSQEEKLLTAKDIMKGLNFISEWLDHNKPGETFQIVVAGGTCSVLLFKNRDKTKDVDIFSPDATVLRDVLQAGRRYTQTGGLSDADWINAEMIAHISGLRGSDQLLTNSITQNVLLYDSPSLQVFAADWKYQAVGKIKRALDYKDSKDISDAVEIVRRLNRQSGHLQSLAEMQTWYEYGALLTTKHLEFINAAYNQKYGTLGIVA